MQKSQPNAQPTWEETQNVVRSGSRIATASTSPPPGSAKTTFSVPSAASAREAIRGRAQRNSSAIRPRSAAGRSVHAEGSTTPRR